MLGRWIEGVPHARRRWRHAGHSRDGEVHDHQVQRERQPRLRHWRFVRRHDDAGLARGLSGRLQGGLVVRRRRRGVLVRRVDDGQQLGERLRERNRHHDGAGLGTLARGMYPGYTGHRPRVQLFHGDADGTIKFPNFGEAIKQWTNVLGLATSPTTTTTGLTLGTHQATRQQWKDSCGYVVLDAFESIGGDHGPSDALFDATYVRPLPRARRHRRGRSRDRAVWQRRRGRGRRRDRHGRRGRNSAGPRAARGRRRWLDRWRGRKSVGGAAGASGSGGADGERRHLIHGLRRCSRHWCQLREQQHRRRDGERRHLVHGLRRRDGERRHLVHRLRRRTRQRRHLVHGLRRCLRDRHGRRARHRRHRRGQRSGLGWLQLRSRRRRVADVASSRVRFCAGDRAADRGPSAAPRDQDLTGREYGAPLAFW